jgi:iron(III) transport system permease protein
VGLAIALVAYLTLVPLLMLIYGSLQSGQPGEPADFTLKNYLTLLGKWRLVPAFLNSLIFSFGASFLTFAGGLYLAWMTERTNIPWKGALYAMVLVPMVVPGLLTTVGWIILFSRRTGIVNIVATQYLGFEQPLEINNMIGMIWVLGVDQIPLAFLLLAPFRSMDPSLKKRRWLPLCICTTLHYLRVLLPAILAAWMITFVRAIENLKCRL